MSIVRVGKKDHPFTMIANTTLQDTTISLDAKGVLVWLLSKPEDWTVYKSHLQRTFGIGRERMDRIFDELERAGYVESQRFRMPDGTFRWAWTVYEQPLSGKPATGEPATGNPSSTNKDLTKNRQTKSRPAEPADASPIVKELASNLADRIEANGFKRPQEQESWTAIRRMIEIDKRAPDEILTMIEWSQANDFWSANIRSAVKLRKHFETMQAQRSRDSKKPATETAPTKEQLELKRQEEARMAEERARWIQETAPMPEELRRRRAR